MPRGYGAGGYMYAPPPPHAYHDDRYEHHQHPHYAPPAPFPIQHSGYVPYPLPGTILSAPMAPPAQNGGGQQQQGGGVIQVVHTDDAATKLSDRVRRRCFNCCTTDTSTWRRSNLSPGKVLCNKCGLFERTHSRPRPEQFPHKRGPLATSTLRSRSPPAQQAQPTYNQPTHYPPPNAQSASAPPPQSHPSQSSSSASQQSPYIAPLAGPGQNQNGSAQNGSGAQNGSASHPGTPLPSPNPNTNGSSHPAAANGSPRLPGVDSWLPEEKRERRDEREERGEREQARGEERRERAGSE
ncbi:hypothetical protein C8R44DRAFT_824756 [Mycena epipterygia]|nr:hypothetical protein C8R44DRAFT_824756 [Mycena epipterygia]